MHPRIQRRLDRVLLALTLYIAVATVWALTSALSADFTRAAVNLVSTALLVLPFWFTRRWLLAVRAWHLEGLRERNDHARRAWSWFPMSLLAGVLVALSIAAARSGTPSLPLALVGFVALLVALFFGFAGAVRGWMQEATAVLVGERATVTLHRWRLLRDWLTGVQVLSALAFIASIADATSDGLSVDAPLVALTADLGLYGVQTVLVTWVKGAMALWPTEQRFRPDGSDGVEGRLVTP